MKEARISAPRRFPKKRIQLHPILSSRSGGGARTLIRSAFIYTLQKGMAYELGWGEEHEASSNGTGMSKTLITTSCSGKEIFPNLLTSAWNFWQPCR